MPLHAVMRRLLLVASLVGLCVSAASAQPLVEEIEIQGDLRRVAESLIRTTAGVEPGVELSQENVQEALRALQGLNVFEDIQLWAEQTSSGTGLKLIIVVKEYPTLKGVRYKGHKEIKERDMKDAVGLVAGQVVAPKDVARGRQRILQLYEDKGYLSAQVEGTLYEGDKEGEVYLQYDIVEGEKIKVAAITIIGNEQVERGKLQKQMETKPKRWWRGGEFKADVYDEDKQRMLAYYRSLGYQQAAIVRDSIYYDDTRQRLFIDIEVDEGSQYFVGEFTWEGNELFDGEQLASALEIRHGDVFQYSAPELAYLAKQAYYERGYLDTEIIPHEIIYGDSIDVAFQVFEGEPWRIRRIDFAGNVKTREKVLRREIALRPGDVFKQSQLQESQRRLFMLGFFEDVQVNEQTSPYGDEKFIDLNFTVKEQRTGAASMGAGYSDRDKLVGQLGLQIPNFRGLGQNLDFSWEFGTRREQFLFGFTEPWLLDTPTSLSFRLYTLNQQYLNSFEFKRNSVSLRVGRRLKKPSFTTVSLGYELRDERYNDFASNYNPDDLSFQPRTTSSLELTVRRDTRDLPDFPTSGTVFSYSPELASSLIAGDTDFHRHELVANYYRPSWWKFVLAVESKFALIDGFSTFDDQNISFWDKFTPGGVDLWDGQVRGYPDASLGPRFSAVTDSNGVPTGKLVQDVFGTNTGGRSMMTLNLEYRFPITERQVIGLAFFDAGNAWAGVGDFDPTDLRKSIGVGFRVLTPMLGMIGFDFAYGFDRRKVDGQRPGISTHFQFGPRFF
ncbi:MAG: outer membrane protein assembly factor BamA [Candidatus Latescibacterota bacterium]|nr:outer membrane protein assembly factor BamA [Candidatus Latescibacterota bacterium]